MHLPQIEASILALVRDSVLVGRIQTMNEEYGHEIIADIAVGDLMVSLKASLTILDALAEKDLLKNVTVNVKRSLNVSLNNLHKYFQIWVDSGSPSVQNYNQRDNVKNEIEKIESFESQLAGLLHGQIDFQSEVSQFLNFKKKTKEADAMLSHIAASHERVRLLTEDASSIGNSISILHNEVKALLEHAQQEKKSMTILLEEGGVEQKRIIENRQEVETSKENIIAFQQNIDDYRRKITEMLKEQEDAAAAFKTEHNNYKIIVEKTTKDTIADFDTRTTKIIKNNEEYQTRISELLGGANAGVLNETYKLEVKDIDAQLKFWIGGIILITLAAVAVSIGVFYFLKGDFWELFADRFLLVIPLLLLDGFFILQYNKRQRMLEEYRYRSTIAVSLWAFNDLVKQNKEEDILKTFVVDAINRMFESPFKEEGFSRSQRNMLNTLLNKFGEKAEKGVDGLIETVTKR